MSSVIIPCSACAQSLVVPATMINQHGKCPRCQAVINLRIPVAVRIPAIPPPLPPQDTSRNKKLTIGGRQVTKVQALLGLIGILVFILVLASVARQKKIDQPEETFSAGELDAIFSRDEAKATERWKGRRIAVRGYVYRVIPTRGVALSMGPEGQTGVFCRFRDENDLIIISTADVAEVSGVCQGRIGIVELTDCIIRDMKNIGR